MDEEPVPNVVQVMENNFGAMDGLQQPRIEEGEEASSLLNSNPNQNDHNNDDSNSNPHVNNEEMIDDEDDYTSSDDDYFDYVDELLDKTLVDGGDEPPIKKQRICQVSQGSLEDFEEEQIPEHIVTNKIVLKKRDQDYFEVLPEGWVEVTHFSGMPVYLHKHTRVCSLSKPYFLGPGSARKHDIPISAIPCLQYRREVEREKEEEDRLKQALANNGENLCPAAKASLVVKVQSVEESKKKNSLPYNAVRDYCSKLFEFQKVPIRKFKTWADRRAHTAMKKRKERPSLPEGTKLITIPTLVVPGVPISKKGNDGKASGRNTGKSPSTNETTTPHVIPVVKKKFVMNPAGKSDVCVLHEFIQHSERVQPQYRFTELENPTTPYSATVIIKGKEYGVGYGSSKKSAKAEAARKTLEIFVPGYSSSSKTTTAMSSSSCSTTTGTSSSDKSGNPTSEGQTSQSNPSKECKDTGEEEDPLAYFDRVSITDERVSELSNTAGQPSPYQVLVECLKRNHGLGDTEPSFRVDQHKGKQLKNKFTMTIGDHTVTGFCKNSRQGKQLASQMILEKLHPKFSTWGQLLRLYGRGSCKTPKEKKEEEQKITELQATALPNRPNYAILNKLKEEMGKLSTNGDSNVPDANHLEAVHL